MIMAFTISVTRLFGLIGFVLLVSTRSTSPQFHGETSLRAQRANAGNGGLRRMLQLSEEEEDQREEYNADIGRGLKFKGRGLVEGSNTEGADSKEEPEEYVDRSRRIIYPMVNCC